MSHVVLNKLISRFVVFNNKITTTSFFFNTLLSLKSIYCLGKNKTFVNCNCVVMLHTFLQSLSHLDIFIISYTVISFIVASRGPISFNFWKNYLRADKNFFYLLFNFMTNVTHAIFCWRVPIYFKNNVAAKLI